MRYGLTLSGEEHPPARLVELARMAQDAGFDFVSVSDHFHPWVGEQGHGPFVWGVLGAISSSTETIEVAVGVTCPIMRIHPAVLAQATATASLLLGGRFTWGVGTGEALNEHILGDRWPPHPIRLEMLEEAIEIVRELWGGDSVTRYGKHFTVEDARIFDAPPDAIPVVVSAFGPEAAELAARAGDGLWVTGAAGDTIDTYRGAGGKGPIYSQLTLCWGTDREKAVDLAHRLWAFSSLPGQLSQDLRTVHDFEEAVEIITPDQVAESMPCGPDPDVIIAATEKAIAAGVNNLYFHQIGPDQEGFIELWAETLAGSLKSR